MNIFHELTEDKFCKHFLATDINERAVQSNNSTAVKWCALGWYYKSLNSATCDSKLQKHKDMLTRMTEIAYSLCSDSNECLGITEANDRFGYAYIEKLQEELG
ncbi:MAG: hypothetical protein ACREAG_07655 [Nitrosopumilaceae archaeon]